MGVTGSMLSGSQDSTSGSAKHGAQIGSLIRVARKHRTLRACDLRMENFRRKVSGKVQKHFAQVLVHAPLYSLHT